MDIKYVKHDEILYDLWDDTVIYSVNASVFGRTWFLDSAFPNWEAIIWEDYKAVMPVFVVDGKAILPEWMPITGIYFEETPKKESVHAMLKFLCEKFPRVNINLDKFSYFGGFGQGVFKKYSLYQFDTIKGVKKAVMETSPFVRRLMLQQTSEGFVFSKIPNVSLLERFLKLNEVAEDKSIEKLCSIVEKGEENKSSFSFCLATRSDKLLGIVTAIYDDNYIYLPQLTVFLGVDVPSSQMIMLYHILTFFENSSAVLLIDPQRLKINEQLLQGMGGKKFEYTSFQTGIMAKLTNLFNFGRK